MFAPLHGTAIMSLELALCDLERKAEEASRAGDVDAEWAERERHRAVQDALDALSGV